MDWKKYIATILALAAIISVGKSCGKDEEKSSGSNIVIPRITPAAQTEVTPQPSNMYAIVNESVYHNLVEAKRNFEQLFQNGDVSSQLKSHGISLSGDNADFIRSNAKSIYDTICSYIQSFEKGDSNACYSFGASLYDYYYHTLSREYLYNVMVASQLPSAYQDSFSANPYDSYGNICLQNGNKICFIGGSDDLVCPTPYYGDYYNDMYVRSEWYKHLPSILCDYYGVLKNSDGDNGICYIMNEARAERYCSGEWASIKEDGQSIYGFNAHDARVVWDYNANCYIFVGPNDEVYGPLTSSEASRVNGINTVQDALVLNEGSPYTVDSCIRDMLGRQSAKTYIYY